MPNPLSKVTSIGPRRQGSGPLPDDATVLGRVLPFINASLKDPIGIGAGSQINPQQAASRMPFTLRTLRDKLGEIFEPPPNSTSGIGPVRLTSHNPDLRTVSLSDVKSGQPFESSYNQFDELLRNGELLPQGAGTEGMSVPSLAKRLLKVLGE